MSADDPNEEEVRALYARIAELEALLGKWMCHDGHVCPSCGMPDNRMQELEAENKRLHEQLDTISGNRGYYTPWEKT